MDFRRYPVGRFEFRSSPFRPSSAWRVRRVVVSRREVTAWAGLRRWTWTRGGVVFVFPSSHRRRRRRPSRRILVVSGGSVVTLDASSFRRARYRLLRRHLENFMATAGATPPAPRFVHPGQSAEAAHRIEPSARS
ncbi:hypothetical protein NY547_14845 [Cnuibacter physcomitrellae]|uniref:hypothetical protein n=1 Tax=Cnuibacter physcomitrellae TaxID=1619308 RepID=UPI002175F4ED|nr:hypothetical protein [Cnuibacter physcomitrellae]MCS5498529.1 hypothetical protein [Cnuibacter physcomitrellae]